MSYNVILFDLDGTLTDPKVGITKSVQYALDKLGVTEHNLDRLEPFIGPPLQESFAKYYAFDEYTSRKAIEYYREYFTSEGMFENIVYTGIPELLHRLIQAGNHLFVATSKPTVFAEKILSYFELDTFFEMVVGSNLDGTRIAKTEIIEHIMGKLPGYGKSEFIMIGDRKHDIIGAKNTGIHSIGVTYGYGSYEEIRDASPTYLAEDVHSIGDILL